MATALRGGTTLRDVPQPVSGQSPGSLAEYVDSLPDARSFFERLSGDTGLQPGVAAGESQIKNFEEAIIRNELDAPRVQKLMKRNPLAAARFATALDRQRQFAAQQDILQRHFSPGTPEQAPVVEAPPVGATPDVVTSNQFQSVSPRIPAQAPRADPRGAMLEAASRGDLGLVKSLKDTFEKSGDSLFAKINPKDFTQTSVSKFEQTQRFADLVPAEDSKIDPEKIAAHAKNLRTEFQKLSKAFIDVRDSFGRIEESAKAPSPAGDLSMIFNFMKMLDPESVVRESEFATAAATGSYGERIQGLVNEALNGKKLADSVRNDFVARAKALYRRQLASHKNLEKQYGGLARRLNVQPQDVVVDFSLTPLPATTPGTSTKPALDKVRREKIEADLLRQLRGQ